RRIAGLCDPACRVAFVCRQLDFPARNPQSEKQADYTSANCCRSLLLEVWKLPTTRGAVCFAYSSLSIHFHRGFLGKAAAEKNSFPGYCRRYAGLQLHLQLLCGQTVSRRSEDGGPNLGRQECSRRGSDGANPLRSTLGEVAWNSI